MEEKANSFDLSHLIGCKTINIPEIILGILCNLHAKTVFAAAAFAK